jgi:hypothetical protein
MTLEDDKAALIERIDYVRDRIAALIEGVEPDTVIHDGSGWRLRDVLAHIAAWQGEAVAAGYSHIAGQGELPRRDIARFNQAAYEEWARLGAPDVLDAWQAVYDDLKDMVRRAPAEAWTDEFVYPWSEKGTLATLVRSILSHDAEHVAEIRAALDRRGAEGKG